MKPFRLPILGLMAVVLGCGLAFAALREPSAQWASLTFTAAMTVLLFALLALFVGRYRTFWLGFVIFGWGYAYLAFGPRQWDEARPFLYTSRILSDAYQALLKSATPAVQARLTSPTNVGYESGAPGLRSDDLKTGGERFQRIGHSIASILHGVAGGLLAVFLARRKGDVGSAIADHSTSETIAGHGPQ
jgi:hypothetical protein